MDERPNMVKMAILPKVSNPYIQHNPNPNPNRIFLGVKNNKLILKCIQQFKAFRITKPILKKNIHLDQWDKREPRNRPIYTSTHMVN